MTSAHLIDVVRRSGGKDCKVVATNAEGGEGRPLEHEDVVDSLPGDIGARIGVFPGKNYLPPQFLQVTDVGSISVSRQNLIIQWASPCSPLLPPAPSHERLRHASISTPLTLP
jgi:hypothetical protein